MERNEGHGSCTVPGVEEEGKAKTKWQRALREQSVLEEWVGRQDITDKARTAQHRRALLESVDGGDAFSRPWRLPSFQLDNSD